MKNFFSALIWTYFFVSAQLFGVVVHAANLDVIEKCTSDLDNPKKLEALFQKNRQKFAAVKNLGLPIGQYAITGSGALGIRNLREIGDVDIIVTADLWNILAAKYGVTDEGVKKIAFPDGIVEAFAEGSFYAEKKDPDAPTIADRIANAEIIDGLPFESLEYVLYYKRKMGREKDLRDIQIIEEWQKAQTSECR